ncbi:hypothetical protein [Bacillus thuringiensis]
MMKKGLMLLFITFLFFSVSTQALAEVNKMTSTSTITDINGNPVVTGKPYYVTAPYINKGGWNSETYLFKDYILLSHSDTSRGKTVIFNKGGTKGESGIPIKENDPIGIHMQSENYPEDKYFSYSSKVKGIYLDSGGKVFYMNKIPNDTYVNKVRFIVGQNPNAHLNFESGIHDRYWANFTHIYNYQDIINLGQSYPGAVFTLIPAD